MVFWLDEGVDKSRENTNLEDLELEKDSRYGVIINDPVRPVDQNGRVFEQVPPTRQRKKYAKHSDRILKKLPVNERRRQMQMRRSIEQEIDFA